MNKILKTIIFSAIVLVGNIVLVTNVNALAVSCSVSKEIVPSYDSSNNSVDFQANITDGTGPYTVEWSGDLTASGESFTETFTNAGQFFVEVDVTDSVGSTTSAYCPEITSVAVLEYNSCAPKGEMNTHTGYESSWKAQISGGLPPYSMTWSGTDDLTGSNVETNITYDTIGEKYASVANITSTDGQSVLGTFDCTDPIYVYEEAEELSFDSCGPSGEMNSHTGYEVGWRANISGGLAPYSMTWSGTDGLTGSAVSTDITYNTAGTKTATVSNITSSDGKSLLGDFACSESVTVYENPTDLTSVSCSVDDTEINTNGNVTWSATVVGGNAPYQYDWSGTDSLTGDTSSITKTYSTTGTKTASVNVTTDDGQTMLNVACDNNVSVSSGSTGGGGSSSRGGSSSGGGSSSSNDNEDENEDDLEDDNESIDNNDNEEEGFDGYTYTSTPINNVIVNNDTDDEDSNEIENLEESELPIEISSFENTDRQIDETDSNSNNLRLVSNATLAFDKITEVTLDYWYTILLHIIILGLVTYLIVRKK